MRFGLVGTGVIGDLRAQALQNTPGLSLRAVCDIDADRARAFAERFGCTPYTRYEDLLERDDLDAVIVSTPPQFHEEQVIGALASGRHVLCEKPLTNSVDSARRMLEAARAHERTLTTGFNHRYFSAIQYVKETLDQGLIGELDHVRAFAGHTGLSEFRSPSEYDKKVIGGGAFMDVGIHLVDLTRFILGDVTEVYGVATDRIWQLDGAEDNGLAIFKSPEGKHATVQATWAEWKGYRFHLDVYGTHGMVRAYYAPMFSMRIVLDEPGGNRQRSFNLYPRQILREKLSGWQSTVVTTFTQEFADFVRHVQGGAPGSIADDFAGFRTVEIAHAIYACSQDGQPRTLTPRF